MRTNDVRHAARGGQRWARTPPILSPSSGLGSRRTSKSEVSLESHRAASGDSPAARRHNTNPARHAPILLGKLRSSFGGGISLDGRRWISSRPAFLLPVRVLGALFRRLFLTQLIKLHEAGKLAFFGTQAGLADHRRFLCHLAPVRKKRWMVYAKPPFTDPDAVLAYLSRYTHRVAISNQRLIAFDETGVTFRYKDYRRDGLERQRVMTLAPHEFIRRFLLHVLPHGFHRIRHYGLLASSARKANIARARELLAVAPPPEIVASPEPPDWLPPCPCCGGRMTIVETFGRWRQPRAPPQATAPTGSSTS